MDSNPFEVRLNFSGVILVSQHQYYDLSCLIYFPAEIMSFEYRMIIYLLGDVKGFTQKLSNLE